MATQGGVRSRLFSILSLYIGRQFILSFASCLAVVAALVFLFDTLELLRRTSDNADLGLARILALAILKMPHTVLMALPFVVLLGMMHTLFRLVRSHELMVIRSSGISVWQFLAPPILLTFCLGVMNVLVVDPYVARLYDSYRRLDDVLVKRFPSALKVTPSGGLWLVDTKGSAATFVFAPIVREVDNSVLLTNVTILVTDHERLVKRYEAAQGTLGNNTINLDDVWDITLTPGRSSSEHLKSYVIETSLSPEKAREGYAAPETMYLWDLHGFIDDLKAAGLSALPYRLYWQSQLTLPLLLVSMVLIASAFYLTVNAKMTHWVIRGATGLSAGFLYYFFDHFFYALGLSSTLPPVAAAWAPPALALALGLTFLLHHEDG